MQTKGNRIVIYTIALILMWGFTWPILKVGLYDCPPILYSGLRTGLAGLVLFFLAPFYSGKMNIKELWPVYLISSIFNVILFYGLQTIALNHLPSGLQSVLVYLQPILVAILAWLWLGDSLNLQKVIGLILGFIGVASISIKGIEGHISIVGIILSILSALSWALGTVYWKHIQGQADPLWLVAIPFTFGGIVLTAIGSFTESFSQINFTGELAFSLTYTILIGTTLSWITYLQLVHLGEVSKVAAWTFFVPLLSVIVSAVWLHEPVNISLVIGLVSIVIGIYLVNHSPSGKRKFRQSNSNKASLL